MQTRTHSIYHFFADLLRKRAAFDVPELGGFPFDETMLSCRNDGIFPDLAIRVNQVKTPFTGGELIELKDSQGYSIASFNSTIPTGKKDIAKVVTSEQGTIYSQMLQAGDDINSLPEREVFYLIRGRRRGHMKVCLVHGSFFETVRVEELIQQAFGQVLNERMGTLDFDITEDLKMKLAQIFSEQASFSRVRDVPKSSVKLRFRIMTEAKREGNILNPRVYPDILDDTLNLIVPRHDEDMEGTAREHVRSVLLSEEYARLRVFTLKHLLNGPFNVFQVPIQEAKHSDAP